MAFNVLTAASLLLCLATVAMWVRSNHMASEFKWVGVHRDTSFRDGRLVSGRNRIGWWVRRAPHGLSQSSFHHGDLELRHFDQAYPSPLDPWTCEPMRAKCPECGAVATSKAH